VHLLLYNFFAMIHQHIYTTTSTKLIMGRNSRNNVTDRRSAISRIGYTLAKNNKKLEIIHDQFVVQIHFFIFLKTDYQLNFFFSLVVYFMRTKNYLRNFC